MNRCRSGPVQTCPGCQCLFQFQSKKKYCTLKCGDAFRHRKSRASQKPSRGNSSQCRALAAEALVAELRGTVEAMKSEQDQRKNLLQEIHELARNQAMVDNTLCGVVSCVSCVVVWLLCVCGVCVCVCGCCVGVVCGVLCGVKKIFI